jgi:hypothetical protein
MHGRLSRWVGAALVGGIVAAGCATSPHDETWAPFPSNDARSTPAVRSTLDGMPVSFVANNGRWDPRASWVASGRDATAYFVDAGVRWALPGWALDQTLVGARPARPTASVAAPGTVSYFGDKPAAALPTATELTLTEAWPGVDVTWSGAGGHIEATYHLAAGADPAQVRVAWLGAESVAVTPEGRLSVTTPVRTFEEDAPRAFQDVDGRRLPVEVAYELVGDHTYGFRLGAYDPTRPLVIDPAVLLYASFLGGSGQEEALGTALDSAGNVYVTGYTLSDAASFPETPGAFQATRSGGSDAFVAKVSPTGSTLLYATFLGGSANDVGYDIVVDGAGNASVTGSTYSSDFPTANPLQATLGGPLSDAFVTRLNPGGTALLYSTFLGGALDDRGFGITGDGAGNVYVTGNTSSTNFPTANALQAALAGAWDGFVTKINPAGSALVYSTYLGGTEGDDGNAVATDGAGNAYVVGMTDSGDFPTVNSLQAARAGNWDGFVTKLNADGSALVYSTYLGGDAYDEAFGVAVDGSANVYLTGVTFSMNFPTANAVQSTNAGSADAFVTKLNAAGSALVYSTYLGGSGFDDGRQPAVDGAGNTYVTGSTESNNFPTANAFQPTHGGGFDAFVTKLNAAGSALVYSTYLGGDLYDVGTGIAVDGDANAHVSGYTVSGAATFPETPGVFQPAAGGNGDAFVAKIADRVPAGPGLTTSATPSVTIGGAISDTATVTGPAPSPPPTGTVTFRLYGPDDTNCAGAPVFTSPPRPLAGGPPPTATSGIFTPTVPGTYRWIATYSGDANYLPVTGACNAAGETSVVTKASPTISTQASAGGMVGTPVRDVATLAGGSNPTGTVTFRLFSDPNCQNQVFTSTNAVAGATATSGDFTPTAAGTYHWTAVYSGDANNNPATSACGAANESVVITAFQAPAYTRTITGDLLGPVTVNAGESVLITTARVVGPVTVNPGGALTVVNSQISRGVFATAPSFISMCGSQVSGPPPATALSVTGAQVPIRVGDPATGCAGNRFAGQVVLSSNLAVTFGANTVSHNTTINSNGPGNTVVKANTVFGTLACAGNNPPPTNAGQPNTAGAKTGQCAGL